MANSYFCTPLTVALGTVPSANAANPGSNMLNDEPDLVWRSATGTTSTHITIDASSQAVDVVALLFTNLRSTDTIRVRGYTSQANATAGGATGLVAGSDSGTVVAYTGAAGHSTKTVVKYSAPISAAFWRIDITATGHSDGYIEVARLLLGSSVELGVGMDQRAARMIDDRSVVYSGPGYDDVDEYPSLPGWRVTFSWVSDTTWRDTFFPFLVTAGLKKCVLFVPEPDFPAYAQNEIVYGRFRDKIEGEHPTHNGWTCELTIFSIAP